MEEIKNVEVIKEIGKGSYGSVSLVRVAGTPCVSKSLHDILLGRGREEFVSDDQRSAQIKKFHQECSILWKLHHPHIVQFMGIHYREESGANRGRQSDSHNKEVSLIMEYLPISLEDCIKICSSKRVTIPLTIKLSVLRDVTYGLTQLHLRNIIHRDLSASNILLTPSLKAKISDFGVSKLITPDSALKFSMAPGAQYIMPPEAYDKDPHYSVKFDIFSFGVNVIYLLLQEVPSPTNSMIKSFHVDNKQIEIGKREIYMQKIERNFKLMKPITADCLQDIPEKRPASDNLGKLISQCIQEYNGDIHEDILKFIKSTQVGKRLLVRAT